MNDFHRTLEQSSLRTWAALHTEHWQGLALRTSHGYTKRSNSVSVLDYNGDFADIQSCISHCEAYYHAQQLPTIFKITEDEASGPFDNVLERQRYEACDLSLVQWLPLTTYTSNDSSYHSHLYDRHITEWIRLAGLIGNMSDQAQQMIPQLLEASQCLYAGIIVYIEGQPAACALAVCDGAFVGIYDVMTSEIFRRRGLARDAVNELLSWGKQVGAQYAYLQVLANNEPACKLYQQLGFQHGYRYWYRVEHS